MSLPAAHSVFPASRQSLSSRWQKVYGRRFPSALWAIVIAAAVGSVVALPALAAPAQGRKGTTTVLQPSDLAQPEEVSALPEELTGIETAEVGLLKLWFERRRLLEQGDREGAAYATERIMALMEDGGIRGMENLASALAYEGQQQLEAGDYLVSATTFRLALRFDPVLPAANLGLAHANRLAGKGFLGFIGDLGRGVRASTGNFWWTYLKLGNTLLRFLLALSILAVTFVVLMLVRYHSSWRHDMFEKLSARGMPEGLARLLSAALVVLPLLLWIAGPWILLYWLVGTFRYMRHAEKGMAIAVLVFVLVVTPAFGAALSIYHMTANDTFRATVSATSGGYEPEKVKYIQHILEGRPDDQTVRFLLASQLKDGGYFLQAFEHYKKLLDLQPDDYRSFNNMGNIYFATQQFGQAINYYRRATEVEPTFALAYFNTYLAQKEQFHFTEAEASLIRARDINAEAVAQYLAFSENVGSVTPVDARIELSEVWVQLARESSASPLLYPGSFITTAGFLNPLSVAALVALALSLALNSLLRGQPACCCGRCGRAYCRDCQGEPGPVGLCPRCVDVAEGLQDSNPEARSHRVRQVMRYQSASRLGRRFLSLVLPGAGHFLTGKTLRGFVLLLGWFFLSLHLVLDRALLSFPGYTAVAGGVPMLLIGLLATVWLLGNLVRFPAFR